MIRTYLVDDHNLFCEGIDRILTQSGQFHVLQKFYNGASLLEKVQEWEVDLLIMDIEMPLINGLDIIKRVKLYNQQVKIALLTMHEEQAYIQEAYLLGADAYLNKSMETQALIGSLLTVCTGKKVFPRFTLFEKENNLLSKREEEILKLIARGKTSATIAEALQISELTVKTHRRNMMRKLQANNTSEMITKAIEKGII
ncbi:response regulator transcription factor [Cytophagaceae bacterium DM2B3-1]|uniref:Response regulator transcription factor n=1 Tax=Xanthocytophaga flava TaxID=3048013 RepID=A0ABT7CX32_9BACT|nr:response regulator transcription factor [Xanthocytophaga flavus]MDJ1473354.1 response regulator transcription factor [Xanthocytophaga flavus]MDJ1498334.1 response regulator transcription factor [Xanthocytophaga flavus]